MRYVALLVLLAACEADAPKEPAPPERAAPTVTAAPSSTAAPGSAWDITRVDEVALGRSLALAHDGQVTILDPVTGFAGATLAVAGRVKHMFWDADGKRLAIVSVEKGKGTPTMTLRLHHDDQLDEIARGSELLAAFSPTSIAVTSWGNVKLGDQTLEGQGTITALIVRSDGRELALGRRRAGDSFVEVWDLTTFARKRRIPCSGAHIGAIAWSADWSLLSWTEDVGDNHHVATVDRDGKVTRSPESTGGHGVEVLSSGDGKWLMSISNGPTVWRAADLSRHLDLRPGKKHQWGAAFASTPDRLALYGADSLRLVDVESGRTLAKVDVNLGPRPNAWSFEGDRLAAASEVKTVVVKLPTE